MSVAKLVRDEMDLTPPPDGDEMRVTNPALFNALLVSKMHEEVDEIRRAPHDAGEYADLVQAAYELAFRHGITPGEIESERRRKLHERGGFRKGRVWFPTRI